MYRHTHVNTGSFYFFFSSGMKILFKDYRVVVIASLLTLWQKKIDFLKFILYHFYLEFHLSLLTAPLLMY